MKEMKMEKMLNKSIVALTVEEFLELQKQVNCNTEYKYPEVLTIGMAAKYMGYTVSTLYKKTSMHQIPFFRQGGNGKRVLFRKEDLDKWLLSNRQEPIEEKIDKLNQNLANTKR